MDKYDYGGWVARYDIEYNDTLTIKQDALKDNHGITVPLVWNHNDTNVEHVIGNAFLENKDKGVYAYCHFYDTDKAKFVKKLMHDGYIHSLSIFVKELKQSKHTISHGTIVDVSFVLSRIDPGIFIDIPRTGKYATIFTRGALEGCRQIEGE